MSSVPMLKKSGGNRAHSKTLRAIVSSEKFIDGRLW
jgi:hypothetical protein